MYRNIILAISTAMVFGCGGGGSDSGNDDGGSNIPDETAGTGVVESTDSETVPVSGDGATAISGFWLDCIESEGGSLARAWEFRETEYRTFIHFDENSSDCTGPLGVEQSTQTGSYEIVGTTTSEEGLSVFDIKMRIETVFGGVPADPEFYSDDVYFYVHIDGGILYPGLTSAAPLESGKALFLDNPYPRR